MSQIFPDFRTKAVNCKINKDRRGDNHFSTKFASLFVSFLTFLAQNDRLLDRIYAILMSVLGYVSRVNELLRVLVRRSSPITVIVIIVIIVMLVLCMLVVDNLGRALLDLYPEPGGVQYQRDDGDDEELELEVGAYQLQQQAEFRF